MKTNSTFKTYIKVYDSPTKGSKRVFVDGLSKDGDLEYIFLDTAYIVPEEIVFCRTMSLELQNSKLEGCVIYTKEGDRFFTHQSMRYLLSCSEDYMQTHKSYIINTKLVGRRSGRKFRELLAEFGKGSNKKEHRVPVGNYYYRVVKEFFESKFNQ